jgi:hypothetical protein
MLFFSSDAAEVAKATKEFALAGIPCEVRNCRVQKCESAEAGHRELWIQDDRDCHRAFVLCAVNGIGFSRKASRADLGAEAERAIVANFPQRDRLMGPAS